MIEAQEASPQVRRLASGLNTTARENMHGILQESVTSNVLRCALLVGAA